MKILILLVAQITNFTTAHSADPCTFSAPQAICLSKNSLFKNYRVRKTDTDTTETGEMKDGTLFTLSRGGCFDYGESLSLEFKSGMHGVDEVSYWLKQIATTLKLLLKGNEEKAGALLGKAAAIEKLSTRKKMYKYGDTVKVEDDTFEIYIDKGPNERTKTRVEITTPL